MSDIMLLQFLITYVTVQYVFINPVIVSGKVCANGIWSWMMWTQIWLGAITFAARTTKNCWSLSNNWMSLFKRLHDYEVNHFYAWEGSSQERFMVSVLWRTVEFLKLTCEITYAGENLFPYKAYFPKFTQKLIGGGFESRIPIILIHMFESFDWCSLQFFLSRSVSLCLSLS
jgi:hypothetical protein